LSNPIRRSERGDAGGLIVEQVIEMVNEISVNGFSVFFRQNGVGHDKTCADAILPKGHERQEKTGYKFDAGFVLQ
jgi:hypothetical protein